MAQKTIADKSNKQRPNPIELPRPSNSRHQFTSSQPVNNPSVLSPAEFYINQQSQMVFDVNDSLPGTSSVSSSTNSTKHSEIMQEWHEKQANEIYKNEPYRYKYGTPPSATFRRIDTQPDSYDIETSSTNRKIKK